MVLHPLLTVSRLNSRGQYMLPPELIQEIVAIALGQFSYECVVTPDAANLDFLLTLLHVSYLFRECTVNLLNVVFRDSFRSERGGRPIDNPKPSVAVVLRLSKIAHQSPESFFQECTSELLENPALQYPRSSLSRLSMHYLSNITRANLVLTGNRDDLFDNVFADDDLQIAMKHYLEIPAGLRAALAGKIMEEFAGRCSVWMRLRLIKTTTLHVRTICNVLAFTHPFWSRIGEDVLFVKDKYFSNADIACSWHAEIQKLIPFKRPEISEAELKQTGFFDCLDLVKSLGEEEEKYFGIRQGVTDLLRTQFSAQEHEKYFSWPAQPSQV
ncbi:hypothetical protein EWM64_g4371 [Hericium alpestre]|uniref:Uncharacterized protein n=1 Tax=Hericium alpestre TaxID=135208 RepID=A0A4Y9ZZL9_9AGAM|nr:hypothetical protein EWM64_g4371 [Hericium alpestre]